MAPAKRTAKKATKKTAKKTTARKTTAKKTTARRAPAKKAPEVPVFVSKTRVKEYVKALSESGAMRCPDDTIEALNNEVAAAIAAAVKRAEGNKRNTVRGVDF